MNPDHKFPGYARVLIVLGACAAAWTALTGFFASAFVVGRFLAGS